MVGIKALVALEADEGFVEYRRQYLGDFSFADARFTFEKQRPSQLQRQMDGHRKAAIGNVVVRSEGFTDLIN